MKLIPFTDREMQRAYRQNLSASQKEPKTNAQRLLLFYAVECGLKAVLIKRRAVNRSDATPEVHGASHNLNKLLDLLSAGKELKLPDQLRMKEIRCAGAEPSKRKLSCGGLNQVWRYGGELIEPKDDQIENDLYAIAEWIKDEIRL